MVRRYNTANQYNIIGFCNEFQEFIRIVRYLPENRLVCVICLFDSGFWNHPDDINDESKYVILPPETEQNPPFAEVSYEEVAAAGWAKFLRVHRTDYDFNETAIHAAQEDDEKLTLTMWGGFIDGRRLYTNAIPRTNRFFLHIHKPFTIHKGPFNEVDLTERFPEWFAEFASGGAEPVLYTEWYHDGTDFIRFCLRNPDGEFMQIHLKSRWIEVEIDRTDPRLQCIGNELDELCRMEWQRCTYEPYSAAWTHEHCTFCSAPIDAGDDVWMNESIQTEKTKFICTKCMADFSELFGKNG